MTASCDLAERLKDDVQRLLIHSKQLEEERTKWLALLDTENAQLKSLFEDAKAGKEQLIKVRGVALW